MTSPAVGTGIVAFIEARLKEREELALAASPGPWHLNDEHDEVLAVDELPVVDAFALSGPQLRATAEHIAANDPRRVLAEVAKDRAILALHRPFSATDHARCGTCNNFPIYPCQTVRLLAAIDADHPDFDPSWKPEAS